MSKKLRQVTDSIHGTIYLSELESQLMSTPFFYRLHDVYQSSTVYMTFPSNRTKRYEHSLGTMELASEMLFSAIANADEKDRASFLDYLNKYVADIVKHLSSGEIEGIHYCEKSKALLAQYFKDFKDFKESELDEIMMKSIKDAVIDDSALDHFMVCFFDSLKEATDVMEGAKYLYLYQCILQSIRIAALFHDVGHPPYSHIIEDVLTEIFKECKKDLSQENRQFDEEKAERLVTCLGGFINSNDSKAASGLREKGLWFLIPPSEDSEKLAGAMHLHEQVGVKMLQLAIEDIFPQLAGNVDSSELDKELKKGTLVYYITIIEFVFAILLEKSQLFASIHRIIDGAFDADRLDYIVRDSRNAGVNWGKIPYKRIIGSAKLVRPYFPKEQEFFMVAYQQKVTDDIEDVLLERYKIFARINYHHRSIKTATLLQNAVKELAYDYLKTEKGKLAICEEISNLWTALGATLEDQALKVIRWNDSWLITVLYGALVTLSDRQCCDELELLNNRKQTDFGRIQRLLEEVLLNRKHFYSLLKRKEDAIQLANDIYCKARIKTKIDTIWKAEQEKFRSCPTQEGRDEAKESLLRLQILFDKVLANGDLELLHIIFPTDDFAKIIEKVLEEKRVAGIIRDYYVLKNEGRNKKGIPSKTNICKKIYLYDNENKVCEYDSHGSLDVQVNALRATCLGVHIYISPVDGDKDVAGTLGNIHEVLAAAIGKEVRETILELFPSKK